MAYTTTSDSIVIKATLTDKGRKLLSRGKFKIAKFALGDDELDYELLDSDLLETMIADESVTGETVPVPYIPAIKNAKLFEASLDKSKNIQFGLQSYDEGVLYLTDEQLQKIQPDLHAYILYLPILKTNKKLNVSPTLSGSVYYLSVNDETTEKLDTITNFKFLTTNKLENVKIVIESGIAPPPGAPEDTRPTLKNRKNYIIKKFLLDHDYFIYADNKYFRKMVGTSAKSRFENYASGETVVNFKTGQEAPPISLESEFSSYATFISKGIPNLIAAYDSEGTESDTGTTYSEFSGPRGSVIALNPLIDQELQTTSTGTRDFRYSEYGYTEQIVFSELSTSKFDYIDTTIYIIGGTTNSRLRVPIRLIRYTGT
tara:strand:- start:892 stop:2007 length:1116 start_codon:yes stop_codon:yes gene_type:complete